MIILQILMGIFIFLSLGLLLHTFATYEDVILGILSFCFIMYVVGWVCFQLGNFVLTLLGVHV